MHARVCISCIYGSIYAFECESSLDIVNYFINTSLISARPSAHRFTKLSRLGNPFVLVNTEGLLLLPLTSFEAASESLQLCSSFCSGVEKA